MQSEWDESGLKFDQVSNVQFPKMSPQKVFRSMFGAVWNWYPFVVTLFRGFNIAGLRLGLDQRRPEK